MGRGYWLKQFWKDKEVADAKEDGVPLADSNSLELMIAEITDMRDRWWKRHDKREWSQVVMKLTTAKEWLEAAQKSIKEET